VGVSWPFAIYRRLSAPGRNSLKIQKITFRRLAVSIASKRMALTAILTVKMFLGVLPLNFTVRRVSGMRESLQIKVFPPLRIAGLRK
jgi:hypothetical protein